MINIKKFIPILTLILLISGGAFSQNKKNGKAEKDTVMFDVSMTCENCKKRIEKNIAYEKGVTDMGVNLDNKTVKIEFKKDKTSPEKLKAAIEKLGYDVSLHSNDEK